MEIVKNIVEEDIILSNHKLSDKEIIRAYSALVKKLNKHIVDLKIDNDLLIEELELYKKALELACKEIEAHEQGKTLGWLKIQKIKNKFGIDDYKSYYDVFLQKVKEKINEKK